MLSGTWQTNANQSESTNRKEKFLRSWRRGVASSEIRNCQRVLCKECLHKLISALVGVESFHLAQTSSRSCITWPVPVQLSASPGLPARSAGPLQSGTYFSYARMLPAHACLRLPVTRLGSSRLPNRSNGCAEERWWLLGTPALAHHIGD